MEIYMTLSNYDFHFVAGKELCCGGGGGYQKRKSSVFDRYFVGLGVQ